MTVTRGSHNSDSSSGLLSGHCFHTSAPWGSARVAGPGCAQQAVLTALGGDELCVRPLGAGASRTLCQAHVQRSETSHGYTLS